MQEEDPFVFRSDNEERLVIAERNKQRPHLFYRKQVSAKIILYIINIMHTLWQMCIMPVDMADMTNKLNRCLLKPCKIRS